MREDKKFKNIKTIAVINLGFVGDVVNASCITIELRKAYPDTKLIFITVPKSKEIAKHLPGVDEVYVFDKDVEHKGMKVFTWAISLRLKRKIDMVIMLNETFRSGILGFMTGARYRLGHDSEGRGFLLTHTVPWTDEERDLKVHIAEMYMRNLKPLGLYNPDYDFGLEYLQSDLDYVDGLLAGAGYEGENLIGLCPCARYGCKDWNPEEAKELISYINQKHNYKIVVIGQESGRDFAEKLRWLGVTDFIDLTNKTNIPQLSALITRFKAFISVDTAPMHMGIALKVPTMGLFIQDNYKKWWPGDNSIRKMIYQPKVNTVESVIEVLNTFDGDN